MMYNDHFLKSAALTVTLMFGLSACSSMGQTNVSPAGGGAFAQERYPIAVEETSEDLTLVVAPHVFALRKAERDQVQLLAESYKHVGHGPIWVTAPTGSVNTAASIGAAAEIAKIMVDRGIDPRDIKMHSYMASETDEAAPVTVSFKRYHAWTAECGNWNFNYAVTYSNQATANFGCASQSNLAAMVEDPRELIEPTQIDPTDPARRATVMEKYRAGESTASKRGEDESGQVSEVIK